MKKIAVLSILALTPVFVFAATDIQGIIITIGDIIALATPIIVALALLFFFWGLAIYILNTGDEEKKSQGRTIMIWGIIALFVMVSVWGLVRVVSDTFDVDREQTIDVPLFSDTKKSGANIKAKIAADWKVMKRLLVILDK